MPTKTRRPPSHLRGHFNSRITLNSSFNRLQSLQCPEPERCERNSWVGEDDEKDYEMNERSVSGISGEERVAFIFLLFLDCCCCLMDHQRHLIFHESQSDLFNDTLRISQSVKWADQVRMRGISLLSSQRRLFVPGQYYSSCLPSTE